MELDREEKEAQEEEEEAESQQPVSNKVRTETEIRKRQQANSKETHIQGIEDAELIDTEMMANVGTQR